MKIIKKSLFTIIFLCSFCLQSKTEINTKIIVKIDDEIITSFDIKNKIVTSLILSKKEINQNNIDNLKKVSLENLIQNRLKKIELKKYNLKRDEAQINEYLKRISSNNTENLKKTLLINNIDFDSFVEELDIEFKWRKLIYEKYSKKIDIDPEIVKQEIEDNIKKKINLTMYDLSEIEILSLNDGSDKEKINKVLEEVKNFGFESAVKKFSISDTSFNQGKLGLVNSKALSKDILKIVNKLNIGETSGPINKQNKIIFLKLNNKKISNYSLENIDELKNQIINTKKNELYNLYSNSYLSKLRNTKFIQYYK